MDGYYRGGTSMRDYPQARKMDMERLVDAVGMAETNPSYMESRNLGERRLYVSPTGNRGTYGIGRETAKQPGYSVTPWKNFDATWRDEKKQRAFATEYLTNMVDYYSRNRDKMKYGSDPYYEA